MESLSSLGHSSDSYMEYNKNNDKDKNKNNIIKVSS